MRSLAGAARGVRAAGDLVSSVLGGAGPSSVSLSRGPSLLSLRAVSRQAESPAPHTVDPFTKQLQHKTEEEIVQLNTPESRVTYKTSKTVVQEDAAEDMVLPSHSHGLPVLLCDLRQRLFRCSRFV